MRQDKKYPENIHTPILHKSFSLDKDKQSHRRRHQERRMKMKKGRILHHPIPPELPPDRKTRALTSASEQKAVLSSSKVVLDDLKDSQIRRRMDDLPESLQTISHDINDLMPQLVKEIETCDLAVNPQGGKYKGVQNEKKLWQRFLRCYARFTGNIAKSCDFCGISRNHFYRACDRYPTLNLLKTLIDERFIDEVEETTKKHSLLPNSIIERLFLLKTQRKDKYAEGEVKGNIAVEVKFNNMKALRGETVDAEISEGAGRQLSTPTPAV